MKLCDWIPIDKLDWCWLSKNTSPNAIPILEQNLDKVDWYYLSKNTSPTAIPILEQNLDKVDWCKLSYNPNAIPILEKNLDKWSGIGCLKIQMRFIFWNKIWIR